jgi:predicted DNA-binding protein with PD1-like motif
MQSRELTIGRTFGVTFDHGDDFFDTLITFCQSNDIRQGYIPMFLAGFEEAEIVGTSEKLEDPNAPVWSKVHLENVEAIGCGTIAYDHQNDHLLPHIHTSLGIKDHAATGHTSHLLSARVLFLVEMLLIEVAAPAMHRQRNPNLYDVPLLMFDDLR